MAPLCLAALRCSSPQGTVGARGSQGFGKGHGQQGCGELFNVKTLSLFLECLKLVLVGRVALFCGDTGTCWWPVLEIARLDTALGHPSAKPAKQVPGIPFAGREQSWVLAVVGGGYSPLACPSRSRIAPAGRLGASWTHCELLAWLARSSAQSGGRKVGQRKPICQL